MIGQQSPSERRREREAVLAEAVLAPRLRGDRAVRVEVGAGGDGWSARGAMRFDRDRGGDDGAVVGWAVLMGAALWFCVIVAPQVVRLALAGGPK